MIGINYLPLKTEWERKGFKYKQIKRVDDFAIFEQTKTDKTTAHNEELKWFEVIVVTRHNGFTIAKVYMPPAEQYPSSAQWGFRGWTYNNLDDAKIRLNQLITQGLEPEEKEVIDCTKNQVIVQTKTAPKVYIGKPRGRPKKNEKTT